MSYAIVALWLSFVNQISVLSWNGVKWRTLAKGLYFASEGKGHTFESCRVRQSDSMIAIRNRGTRSREWPSAWRSSASVARRQL